MEIGGAASTALNDLEKKQNRRTRWAKVGGILFLLAAALRLIFVFVGPEEIRSCDDSEVQTAVVEMVNEAIKGSGGVPDAQSLSAHKSIQADDKMARCSATVTMRDGTKGMVNYRIEPKKVFIEDLH